jgi:hypothetical protein
LKITLSIPAADFLMSNSGPCLVATLLASISASEFKIPAKKRYKQIPVMAKKERGCLKYFKFTFWDSPLFF